VFTVIFTALFTRVFAARVRFRRKSSTLANQFIIVFITDINGVVVVVVVVAFTGAIADVVAAVASV
jgi:hypothetical protein